MHRAVIIQTNKEIFLLGFSYFREQKPRQVRRSVNLLERLFQGRTERISCHATERHIGGRTSETFRACQLDGHYTQPFDIAHRNAVINLKDLSAVAPECQQQDAVRETNPDGWTSRSKFVFNVFTA